MTCPVDNDYVYVTIEEWTYSPKQCLSKSGDKCLAVRGEDGTVMAIIGGGRKKGDPVVPDPDLKDPAALRLSNQSNPWLD